MFIRDKDERIQELLVAMNREVERRRKAEHKVLEMNAQLEGLYQDMAGESL